MLTVFWKGTLYNEYFPYKKGESITQHLTLSSQCNLMEMARIIEQKSGAVMPHKVALMKRLLANFGWSVFLHPPFLMNLTTSGFAVFVVLKNALGRKLFQLHVEVETFAKSFLANLYADMYNQAL